MRLLGEDQQGCLRFAPSPALPIEKPGEAKAGDRSDDAQASFHSLSLTPNLKRTPELKPPFQKNRSNGRVLPRTGDLARNPSGRNIQRTVLGHTMVTQKHAVRLWPQRPCSKPTACFLHGPFTIHQDLEDHSWQPKNLHRVFPLPAFPHSAAQFCPVARKPPSFKRPEKSPHLSPGT